MRAAMKKNGLKLGLIWLLVTVSQLAMASLPGINSIDDDIPTADQAFQVSALELPCLLYTSPSPRD